MNITILVHKPTMLCWLMKSMRFENPTSSFLACKFVCGWDTILF